MLRNIFTLVGLLSIITLVASATLLMADVIDDFNSPTLDPDLWEMKQVGKASHTIDGGILTMTSPAVDSGIILYHPRNIEDMDITFEIKLDVSGLVDNITCGSMAQLMEPQLNTDINNNLEATLFFVQGKWYIKQDPVVIGQKPPNPGIEGQFKPDWNVIEITFSESEGAVIFAVNGKEAGSIDKNPDVRERYFYISPDTYTSHYTGEVKVDYVKISGPGSAGLAVDRLEKLATIWAELKQ